MVQKPTICTDRRSQDPAASAAMIVEIWESLRLNKRLMNDGTKSDEPSGGKWRKRT